VNIFPTDLENDTKGVTIDALYVVSVTVAILAVILFFLIIAWPGLWVSASIMAGMSVAYYSLARFLAWK
jgi:hypothetical protein